METAIPDGLNAILSIASFVLGGAIGSFLNVCVYRLPRDLSVVRPRSKCPKCDGSIAWYDNIPIVSWLILGAKCRKCSEPISWQYPLVEAITATIFLFVFWNFGPSLAAAVYMLLAASLVLVTFIDLTDWTIPNEVTFPGMPIGIGLSVLAIVVPKSGLLLDDPVMSVAGLFLGGGILYGLDKISLLLLGKRGMGFGDVKLMAMLGAFFGPQGVLLIIVIASLLGSVIGIAVIALERGKEKVEGETGHYLPFGPYIVLGGLIYMFFGPQIIDAYLEMLDVPGVIALSAFVV